MHAASSRTFAARGPGPGPPLASLDSASAVCASAASTARVGAAEMRGSALTAWPSPTATYPAGMRQGQLKSSTYTL